MNHHTIEHDARQTSARLEAAGKLPAGFTANHYPPTPAEQATLQRLRVAFDLALDIDACAALLAGDPVDPDRIDQAAFQRALEPRLVQLVRPLNVLHHHAAA